ncbi:MAG TPA: DUF488 domain-containing protein [Trueperaceae bacterium]|nr:DUF488 domain-containing protein [Trueperaceae bacterium]
MIKMKRAYASAAASDGTRVLVDRIWPRGVTKEEANVDWWAKDVAPSTELRKWFGHDPERWPEFEKRYKKELKGNAEFERLSAMAKQGDLTLVYSAKDEEHNQARVLYDLLTA